MKESVRKEVEFLIRDKKYEFKNFAKRAEEYIGNGIFGIGWLCNIEEGPLSEDLMREFKRSFTPAHWREVCRHQNLSKEFIYEMEDCLDMEKILDRGMIVRDEYRQYKEKQKIHSRFDILDL